MNQLSVLDGARVFHVTGEIGTTAEENLQAARRAVVEVVDLRPLDRAQRGEQVAATAASELAQPRAQQSRHVTSTSAS